jgi:hypothetical protein
MISGVRTTISSAHAADPSLGAIMADIEAEQADHTRVPANEPSTRAVVLLLLFIVVGVAACIVATALLYRYDPQLFTDMMSTLSFSGYPGM